MDFYLVLGITGGTAGGGGGREEGGGEGDVLFPDDARAGMAWRYVLYLSHWSTS
jgi:hypothetical protein